MSCEKEYVERHLGEPLTLALAEICLKRPKDPILYLANWLFHWQRNKNQLLNKRKELELLLRERQKIIDRRMKLEQAFQSERDSDEKRKAAPMENYELVPGLGDIAEKEKDQEKLLELRKHSHELENEEISEGDERIFFVNSPIIEVDEESTDTNSIDKSLPKNYVTNREFISQKEK